MKQTITALKKIRLARWKTGIALLASVMFLMLFVGPSRNASALPAPSPSCVTKGPDVCTVLIVQFNGSLPSSGVTVVATRQKSIGTEDSITMVGKGAVSGDPIAWDDLSQKLATNEYTTLFGVYGTNNDVSNGGPACADPTNKEGDFIVTIKSAGNTIYSSPAINLCNVGGPSSRTHHKIVSLTVNSNTLGGIRGSANYKDTSTGATGKCDPDNSTIQIYGGPDNLSVNNAIPATFNSDGTYQSATTLKPDDTDSGYSVAVLCYSTSPATGEGTYSGSATGVKVVAGKLTTVNFPDMASIKSTGGPQIPPSPTPASPAPPTCESTGFSFSWIVCGAINLLSDAVDGMENLVGDALQVPVLTATTDKGCPSGAEVCPSQQYQIWANFRVYGDIFLVIALLVIVFGESIGGGLLDAYTVKKAVPRILIAAILINISFYIVGGMVDIFNVLGVGMKAVLTQPFTDLHNVPSFALHIPGVTSLGALFIGGAATWGLVASGVLPALIGLLAVFVLLPALFIFIAIVVTVILRIAIIFILVAVAPFAFALWCLPNTEKYFKQWWDTLFKTLLVYPIITVLFAMGNILGIVINQTSAFGGLTVPLSVIAIIAPLAMIPFAFKLAGGILGRAHELMTNTGKKAHQGILGNPNDPNSLRNRSRYKLGDKTAQFRERTVANGKNAGFMRRTAGRMANFGNLQATRSRYNKQRSETLQSQIATGDDTNIRDLFIAQDANGDWYRRMDMTQNPDGSLSAVPGTSRLYDAASGRIAHNKSMSLYGGDKSAVQDALYYEWKKTGFAPDQMNNLMSQYGSVLGEHGFNDKEGAEMGKAVGFRHQGQSLASKYSTFGKIGKDASGKDMWGMKIDHLGLAKEGGFNIGTYQWSNQDSMSFDELAKGYDQTHRVLEGYGQDASGDTIISDQEGDLEEYNGRSLKQVRDAHRRIKGIAGSTDPDQKVGGTDREIPAQGDHAEGTQPTGYGGVSNAPVEVQAAARRLRETVRSRGDIQNPRVS